MLSVSFHENIFTTDNVVRYYTLISCPYKYEN